MKSNATKAAIETSLRKLLQDRTLDEITVKDLVEDCGISRQTFYYHFQDIYAVVEWRFQQVTQQLLEQMETENKGDRKKTVEEILELLRQEKAIVLNAYRAFDRSYLERYLSRWVKPVLAGIIGERAKRYPIAQDRLEFIVDLYVFGLVNILLNWVDRGMPNGMVDRLDYFYILLDGGVDDALRHLSS